jgi:hypothetical protein
VHITSPNTTFPTLLTPGRPSFGLLLLQVDRYVKMVDHLKEGGRPVGIPQSLKLSYNFFCIRMAYRKKRNDDNKKLTRVLSTKLSIEDYNRIEKYTNFAYEAGMIEEPKTSKFLRLIATCPFNELGLH